MKNAHLLRILSQPRHSSLTTDSAQQPFFPKAETPVSTDNDVVVNENVKNAGSILQGTGQADVGLGGF
jgi:hypothetical protein